MKQRLGGFGVARRFFTVGHLATLACQLECAAPKVGNVGRGHDFEDVTLYDFLTSGQVLGSVIDRNPEATLGELVLRSVEANQEIVGTNTNLGIILLLAPLVVAARRLPGEDSLTREGVSRVLQQLQPSDSEQVYRAIALVAPGGLGESPRHDVRGPAPADLLVAMRQAADRDLIARQYALVYPEVFGGVLGSLQAGQQRWGSLALAIVEAHVTALAEWGDSLISRKLGEVASHNAQRMAGKALQALKVSPEDYQRELRELDFWMRSDGHRRNPGSTADLIAAGLFVGLFNHELRLDF